MLTLLLITPIIGSLFILSIQENTLNSHSKMRTIAITTSLVNLLISIFLWLNFDSNTTQFQFVFGSLFMLLAILQIFNLAGTTDFQLLSLVDINADAQKILWLAFFLAFAIKTPLWPFTGWLYRAHADSPLAGSILLAATILKFATYGYIRILINFLPDATNYFGPLVQTIAIITLIYASLTTIIQQDTKTLIAYSSVAHMSVVILGLFSNTIQGIEGAILLALAHGFVSPPVFTILFFIFTLSNTGIPLTLNFLGEQLSLIGI